MVEETPNNKTVYSTTQEELVRIAKSDAAGRKVDKALEHARGKDTFSTHLIITAVDEADSRASKRHDEGVKLNTDHFEKSKKTAGDHHRAANKLAKDHHEEAVKLAKDQNTKTTRLVNDNQKTLLEAVTKAQDAASKDTAGLLSTVKSNHTEAFKRSKQENDAVLKRVDTFDKATQKAFESLTASVNTVHEDLSQAEERDNKAILKAIQANHESTLELVEKIHNDLDTKIKSFREEVLEDILKKGTSAENQTASVRGDLSVALSLLSDIRKDQIGRPERR